MAAQVSPTSEIISTNRNYGFQKGWRGGPGGDQSSAVIEWRKIFDEAADRPTRVLLAGKLVQMALDGNMKAMGEYFNRVLGKPKQVVDVQVDTTPVLSALDQREAMVKMLQDPHTRSLLKGALADAEKADEGGA